MIKPQIWVIGSAYISNMKLMLRSFDLCLIEKPRSKLIWPIAVELSFGLIGFQCMSASFTYFLFT